MPNPKTVYESIKGTDVELACLLAMWLSLRVSEVRGLQFGDICGNVLYVQRRKLCLGGKDVVREGNKNVTSTRMLELPEYIAGMINEIPHDSPTDYIINDSYQNIARHFTQAVAAKGLKMTFHELRHLNASVMLKLGIPNKYAMERGGWSTDATLKQVYQHTFSDERKVVDSMIDDFFNDIVNEKN
jgi:integrase